MGLLEWEYKVPVPEKLRIQPVDHWRRSRVPGLPWAALIVAVNGLGCCYVCLSGSRVKTVVGCVGFAAPCAVFGHHCN